MNTTIAHVLHHARTQIAAEDALWLLADVLQQTPAWLYAHHDTVLDAAQQQRFAKMLARRVAGEPVAYLTGHRGFWTLDLHVSPACLIPRAETELLVETALARLPQNSACAVADLGTGSGAIALALASERPQAQLLATDISPAALTLAQHNAQRLQLKNVQFAHGAWCAPLAGLQFAMIVSNPPYIAANDVHLQQGDLRFEPPQALASGIDGLDALRIICRDAPQHLLPGGWLLLEHGYQQGAAVRALLHNAGLTGIDTVQDWEQRDRISLAQRPL